MKFSKLKHINVQGYIKGHDKESQPYQRCELCNVPIFRNPCSDERSCDLLQGKGKILCNKCAAAIKKMPSEQALHALNNAYDIYKKGDLERETE